MKDIEIDKLKAAKAINIFSLTLSVPSLVLWVHMDFTKPSWGTFVMTSVMLFVSCCYAYLIFDLKRAIQELDEPPKTSDS